ncbi:hypothetical protein L3X38_005877 [Prunus dulcis]|uniref:Uncharacterized protein n=1 Tax=Prunus dulcis TaxID=3755 RepID=A0AAD5F4M6_PRUDU|nr:hypothetical protein L3X38_005877 [Prunus dulcis]
MYVTKPNKDLTVRYGSDEDKVTFIPVLNQPLSSNGYHVILRRGNHKGEACTNSREEDMEIDCCGCTNVPDAKPKPLEPSDVNQQVEIVPREGRIVGVSLLPDLLIQMGFLLPS